eukprot:Colp12_sorted_trinity150504_noHs@20629
MAALALRRLASNVVKQSINKQQLRLPVRQQPSILTQSVKRPGVALRTSATSFARYFSTERVSTGAKDVKEIGVIGEGKDEEEEFKDGDFEAFEGEEGELENVNFIDYSKPHVRVSKVMQIPDVLAEQINRTMAEVDDLEDVEEESDEKAKSEGMDPHSSVL